MKKNDFFFLGDEAHHILKSSRVIALNAKTVSLTLAALFPPGVARLQPGGPAKVEERGETQPENAVSQQGSDVSMSSSEFFFPKRACCFS